MHKTFLLLFVGIGILIAGLPWFLTFAIDPLPAIFHPTQTALANIHATETAEAIIGSYDDQSSRTSIAEHSGRLEIVGTTIPLSSTDIALGSVTDAVSSPSPLPSTRTATPTATPTRTATPTATRTATPTPRPQAQGEARANLATYSCPGSKFDNNAPKSKGEKFRILGWNVNEEGEWLLIEDAIDQPQIWVKLDANVQVQPSNYKQLVPRIACRAT